MREFELICQKYCHAEWHSLLFNSLSFMDESYLNFLLKEQAWLPGLSRLFSAFSIPLTKTNFILFGESPYPRVHSANGYAFWDNAVEQLWSDKGLSTPVNKATSLRNFIKMLLVARGSLSTDTSQQAIAQVDKGPLIKTADQLFDGMMDKGILLLNASLVFSEGKVPFHARHWQPFMQKLLEQIALVKPTVKLILFGKIAAMVPSNILSTGLMAEHPYNISFISNPNVIHYFKFLDLLSHDK